MKTSVFKFTTFLALILAVSGQPLFSCKPDLDVAFLYDVSASVCSGDPTAVAGDCTNFENLRNFILSFARGLIVHGGSSRFAGVSFGSDASVDWTLNDYASFASTATSQQSIINVMNESVIYPTTPSSSANLAAALSAIKSTVFTAQFGDRPNKQNVIVALTSGQQTGDQSTVYAAAQALKGDGVLIYAVGVTSDLNLNIVCGIATPPPANNPNVLNCYAEPSYTVLGLISQAICGSS